MGVKFGNSWYGVNLYTQFSEEDRDNSQIGLLTVASLQGFQRRPSSEAERPETETMLSWVVLDSVCAVLKIDAYLTTNS